MFSSPGEAVGGLSLYPFSKLARVSLFYRRSLFGCACVRRRFTALIKIVPVWKAFLKKKVRVFLRRILVDFLDKPLINHIKRKGSASLSEVIDFY